LIHQALSYILHSKKCLSQGKVNSKFVDEFRRVCLDEQKHYYAFDALELVRSKNLLDQQEIEVLDLGAGSKKMTSSKRKVSEIAKHSLKREKYAKVLFKLANWLEVNHILEVGTSLGISTAYLGKARKKSKITTLEGCPETQKMAKSNLGQLKCDHVQFVLGNFEETLKEQLEKSSFDLLFLDGNHTYDATIKYFDWAHKHHSSEMVIVVDDIYWSRDMTKAWNEIKTNFPNALYIDLYEMGVIFLNYSESGEYYFRVRN